MYLDLLSEGYTDIKIMGINGYDYISNDYHCMICDMPDDCSNCDGVRILPWVQDLPSVPVTEYNSENECMDNNFD